MHDTVLSFLICVYRRVSTPQSSVVLENVSLEKGVSGAVMSSLLDCLSDLETAVTNIFRGYTHCKYSKQNNCHVCCHHCKVPYRCIHGLSTHIVNFTMVTTQGSYFVF